MTTENRTGHPARTASAVMVVVILLALVVFPGFLAAGLSHGKPLVLFVPPDTPYGPKEVFSCGMGPLQPAMRIVFAPADMMAKASRAMLGFYKWEYDLAGGEYKLWWPPGA